MFSASPLNGPGGLRYGFERGLLVHISLVGLDKMSISWITDDSTPAMVKYGTSPGVYGSSANGTTSTYTYVTYTSGEIHNVVIGPLKPNTVYYYQCGLDSTPEFNFKTPPAQLPLKFAIAASWDSFGQVVQPLASQRPWMVTQGNHDVEELFGDSFTSYNTRWRMPFEESGSESNLYYSFEVAGVHVTMLGSYTDFDVGSDQYKWLESDLGNVDREKTPWLLVLIHAPWYNSNHAHQGEHESVDMMKAMEGLLYKARVDAVFTGHVHAYERFTRVYKQQADNCGPVHITIGDGGNREGLATKYNEPQPKISIFREASFGHGELEVVNSSYALWTWHRNDDDEAVVSDSFWLTNLASDPSCNS